MSRGHVRPSYAVGSGFVLPRRTGLRGAARRRALGVPRDRARHSLPASRLARLGVAGDPLASYPGERIKYLSVFGAYVAGVGINSIAPGSRGRCGQALPDPAPHPGLELHDAHADADRRDALRRARRRRVHHLGARQRRAADAPGLLAAAVRRLGVLRQERQVDGARAAGAPRGDRDRLHRVPREGRRRAGPVHARASRSSTTGRGSCAACSFPQALSWVLRVASLYYFLERSGCTPRSTTRCSRSSSTRSRRCSRPRRAAPGRSRG